MLHGRAGLPHLLPDNPHLFLLKVTLTDACELTVELDAAGRLNVRPGPGCPRIRWVPVELGSRR